MNIKQIIESLTINKAKFYSRRHEVLQLRRTGKRKDYKWSWNFKIDDEKFGGYSRTQHDATNDAIICMISECINRATTMKLR